jgi:serine/threonine protein kinase
MPQLACPTHELLHRLMLGQLPLAQSEDLAQHLEECPQCTNVARTIRAEDTLIEAARARTTEVDGPNKEALHRLLERLRRLGPPASAEATAALDAVRYDFLAPAQGPGELGRLGTYRILKVLGSGGMGIVFQAEDVALQRKAALKVMKPEAANKPEARERFLREARAAAALEHEHIVGIYQVSEERGVPFIAMQWLKGMSLEERLQRGGALSTAQVLRLGRQIARGLAVAHEAGLIHRDIKPANLWLEPEQGGHVKILDFGLARAAADEVHLTQSGTILGTPAYLAPEQAEGRQVDHRCDLFSLGVVLYRLCSGRLPFRGDTTMSMLLAVATQQPQPVGEVNPAVPPALAELVMQLLAKDPAARPASAKEVADRLTAIERQSTTPQPVTEQLPAASRSAKPKTRAGSERRRRRGAVVAVALAVLLPLAYLFGGSVIRFAGNKGELIVRVDDPAVEVAVKQNGVVVLDRTTQREFVLTAGDGEVEVYEKASGLKLATKKFTLTRGGKEIVNVQRQDLVRAKPVEDKVAKLPEVLAENLDRRAAKWVLSLGGEIYIHRAGKEQKINTANDLPAGELDLVNIYLLGNRQVSDAGLEHLKGLTRLKNLILDSTQISDAGLEHLKALTCLATLGLNNTRVSDAGLNHLKELTWLDQLFLCDTRVSDVGLEHLKALKNLVRLDLNGTKVSGAELVHLKELTRLQGLHLTGTKVSDAGLEHLQELTSLRGLHLTGTKVSDAGLERLKGLTRLNHLDLAGTRVSDAGLAHLKELTDLAFLSLDDTRVSDTGLEHLRGLTKLNTLGLTKTKVTAAGVAGLRKALPKCNINSDFPAK